MLATNSVLAKRSVAGQLLTNASPRPCPLRRGGSSLPCEQRRRRQTERRRGAPTSAGRDPGKGNQTWGNDNRLAPGDQGGQWLPDSDSYLDSIDAANDEEPLPPTPWQRACSELFGRLQYDYFNWRQDTWSDLQLFMVLNVIVFLVGAWVRGTIIQELDHSALPPDGSTPLTAAWFSLYNVLSVVLGQDLPDADEAGWPSQLFAILTAIFGLASFALVLALIEQVVLEVLERNVKRGSICYESGHTIVLAWCDSARGIAQLTRILTQLCAANRVSGGGVVVVLTQQRGKLEMEELFRDVVPERNRLGTRFVFRQGSPLDPASLRMVAAVDAKAIIVSGDYSKRSKDADAQVLRACVLLDELLQIAHPSVNSGPVVVAQIKTEDVLPLVQYACSLRVIPVPTNKVNARRYVRLLHHPIAAVFSRCLSDFYSPAHGSIDHCPEVEGLTFGELHFRFPDAVLVGLANRHTNKYLLNPAADTRVQHGDEIICMRPYLQKDGEGRYRASSETIQVDPGAGWDSEQYTLRSRDEQPLGLEVSDFDSCLAISAHFPEPSSKHEARDPATPDKTKPASSRSKTKSKSKSKRSKPQKQPERPSPEIYQGSSQGLYMLPVQYSDTLLAGDELLICGWMGYTFMWELIAELDHSDQGLPNGSRVTLFNEHKWTVEYLQEQCARHGIVNLEVRHVCGDPRSRGDMERLLNISLFKGAIVVCDSFWTDAKAQDNEGGLQLLSQAEMLSLDSAMLMVQLNIRLLLEEAGRPSINILCEKLTYIGVTRFEDDARLPLGIAINSASFAAKTLAQVAMEPRFLQAYMLLGQESDLVVQDTSSFAAVGEELSFFQLQARASSVRQVVLGWYRIPTSMSQPLEMVVNPQGIEERSKVRVWNEGDSRWKLVTMAQVKLRGELKAAEEEAVPFWPTSGSGSADGGSVEDALPVWVAERVAAANVQAPEETEVAAAVASVDDET